MVWCCVTQSPVNSVTAGSMAKLCLSKVIVKVAILMISFGGFSAFVAQMKVVCVITSLKYVACMNYL